MSDVLLLRPGELGGLVTMGEAIDAVSAAYGGATEYPVINAPRRRVHSPDGVRISSFPGGVHALGVIGSQTRAELVRQEEGQHVQDEEHGDRVDELATIHPAGHPPVGGHGAEQQQGLPRCRVALPFGSVRRGQDQRLTHRLDDVVGGEDQEHVESEQEHHTALAPAHVGEETEESLERAAVAFLDLRRQVRSHGDSSTGD